MKPSAYMIDLQKRADDVAERLGKAGDHEAVALMIELRQNAYRHWSDLNRIATIAREAG